MKIQRGFTLLEAVVALAIFSVGAVAIYGWVNANLKTLERVYGVQERLALEHSAVEFMRSVDIENQPSGEESFGDWHLSWVSTPSNYSADMVQDNGGKSINRASLYFINVKVFSYQQLIAEFSLSLVGIKKVRNMDEIIFN